MIEMKEDIVNSEDKTTDISINTTKRTARNI